MATAHQATKVAQPVPTKSQKRKRSISTVVTNPGRETRKFRIWGALPQQTPTMRAGRGIPSVISSPTSAVLRQSKNAGDEETDNDKLERIVTTLQEVHTGLTRCHNLEGLSPSTEVNKLFTMLVVTSIEIVSDSLEFAILRDPRVQVIKDDLRRYASDGEGLMEAFHAERMVLDLEQRMQIRSDLNQPKRWEVLKSFPYYQNYVELTRMEKSIIDSLFDINKPPQKYVFIGSGPMPLTAMCLAYLMELERIHAAAPLHAPPSAHIGQGDSRPLLTSLRIHNIDCDPNAISLSKSLAKQIGGPLQCLTFECRAAEKTTSKAYECYDVVYLAALVGGTAEQKMEITREVLANMRDGSLLVLRSAHNLRKILYEPLDLARLTQVKTNEGMALNIVRVVHPTDEVVNSVVVCRVVDTKKPKF